MTEVTNNSKILDYNDVYIRCAGLIENDGNTVVPVLARDSRVKVVTAATTLTDDDDGKLVVLNAAGGATVTLPAVSTAGFHIRVVVGATFSSTNWVLASVEGDNIEGSLIVAGAVVTVDAADQLNFVNSAENIGDFVELISDGTYWYVLASGALSAGAITATG